MRGDQTSVFLTAMAQGAQVMRYPPGVVVLGQVRPIFLVETTEPHSMVAAALVRMSTRIEGNT